MDLKGNNESFSCDDKTRGGKILNLHRRAIWFCGMFWVSPHHVIWIKQHFWKCMDLKQRQQQNRIGTNLIKTNPPRCFNPLNCFLFIFILCYLSCSLYFPNTNGRCLNDTKNVLPKTIPWQPETFPNLT